ncbi:hypothetical protein MnTg02_02799 [bacterium MnTg02]|nr:hypothetical protein MnTg02_02799 [bacterium MnTg02]
MVIAEPAGRAWGPTIKQPLRRISVEPKHPVAKYLTVHAANPRSLYPVHAVINRHKRQQTPALVGIFTTPRKTPQGLAVKIGS